MSRQPPADFEARWRARFENFGKQFHSEALIAGWTANGLETRKRAFLGLLGGAEGRWLEAGCGAGTYLRSLLDSGADEVVGLDYSVPSLLKAQTYVTDETAALLAADARRLPLKDGAFDGVVCFGVTQALSSSDALVSELVRVTRPGGQVWVDGLNGGCALHWPQLALHRLRGAEMRLRHERPQRLKNLLLAAGCADVEVHWVPILPRRYRRWQARLERMGLDRRPWLGQALSHAFMIRGWRTAP